MNSIEKTRAAIEEALWSHYTPIPEEICNVVMPIITELLEEKAAAMAAEKHKDLPKVPENQYDTGEWDWNAAIDRCIEILRATKV